MKILLYILCLFFTCSASMQGAKIKNSNIVISTKQIKLKEFKSIWNPSLIKLDEGFLLSFRYCLAPTHPWISYVGVVLLDENLEPTSPPQLLVTRDEDSLTSSQAEDARLFSSDGQIYLVYNDNIDVENPTSHHRRDMFVAKIFIEDEKVFIGKPLKLVHTKRYKERRIQKNWAPFDWRGNMMFGYSLNPHEVVCTDPYSGECHAVCKSFFPFHWQWGEWRGGTPALLVDGEYLGFFHSSKLLASEASKGIQMHHYFMGAYTFSSEPPFEIKTASKEPIIEDGFYTQSSYDKRVIFPSGLAVVGSKVYVAYGKDDSELWIAIIDKARLKKSLKPVRGL